MLKFGFKIGCVLAILFISVPFIVSLDVEHAYSLPLSDESVILELPDGERRTVSTEEYFIGAAAAFTPNGADEETLRAAYVILNTPEFTENGVAYMSEDARRSLWDDSYEEQSALYSRVLSTVQGQSIIPASNTDLSLFECMDSLSEYSGSYTDILASLFPGGGLKTEK